MGDAVLGSKKAEELRLQQEREKAEEYKKFLNFQITELFNRFAEKAKAVNERLENGKIHLNERKLAQGSTARKLSVSFSDKAISIEIADSDSLDRHERDSKQQSLEFQRRQYHGMIMQTPGDTFFRANRVVLYGLAETDFKLGTSEFGFNILLVKPDDSIYGEWHLMQFSKNITPAETAFGLNISIFLSEYEKAKSSMFHKTIFRKLEDSDIIMLLEKIFLP